MAALIDAGLPARLYYIAYRNNALDTDVHPLDLHQRLLTYVSDAVSGFLRDMEHIGRAIARCSLKPTLPAPRLPVAQPGADA